MEILTGYVLKALVLPPSANLFGILLALLLPARLRRCRRIVFALALASLWLACTPWFAAWMARTLEVHPALTPAAVGDAEAIVVLAGGRITEAPEYGGHDTLRADTLVRVRYGASLHRRLKIPIAVTGGSVFGDDEIPIGVLMADTLRDEFGTPVEWVETKSRNTAQNAQYLRELLPVDRIVLVTHGSHMKRAARAFVRAGFQVTPAPTAFSSGKDISYGFFDWLPSASALWGTRAVLHEWIGLVYYALRY